MTVQLIPILRFELSDRNGPDGVVSIGAISLSISPTGL